VVGYRDLLTGHEHIALISPMGLLGRAPLARLHSECLTGDVFGSQRCDCGGQLARSMERIATEGGVVVYLRGHEGRGVGLLSKLAAYALQDSGFDTVDAQTELGLPIDSREYAAGAAILADLELSSVRLLTNNPMKVNAMRDYGIEVAAVERLNMVPGTHNAAYLRTKRDRMGHDLILDATDEGASA
jgi:3,4-dihydroxy 2-butanone 4-phosphate synthase/GTP cyclohydrolase II